MPMPELIQPTPLHVYAYAYAYTCAYAYAYTCTPLYSTICPCIEFCMIYPTVPSGDELEHTLVVRLGMACADHVEYAYYKAGFKPVCCHCGSEGVSPGDLALMEKFRFVFPTCLSCRRKYPEPTGKKRPLENFAGKDAQEAYKKKARLAHGHRGADSRQRQLDRRGQLIPPRSQGGVIEQPEEECSETGEEDGVENMVGMGEAISADEDAEDAESEDNAKAMLRLCLRLHLCLCLRLGLGLRLLD